MEDIFSVTKYRRIVDISFEISIPEEDENENF